MTLCNKNNILLFIQIKTSHYFLRGFLWNIQLSEYSWCQVFKLNEPGDGGHAMQGFFLFYLIIALESIQFYLRYKCFRVTLTNFTNASLQIKMIFARIFKIRFGQSFRDSQIILKITSDSSYWSNSFTSARYEVITL